jgi:uncharacterized protein YutE (UPF0331/DUF86 family)
VTAPRNLPHQMRTRLADTRSHYRALVLALDRISAADYEQALTTRDADALTQHAYPLERPFEILDNYIVELARLGLDAAGLDSTGSAPGILTRLHSEGVISESRRKKLRDVHDRRNELQHEYPDARATLVYDAVRVLADELPGFFRDYAKWMRALGFGEQN